MLSCVYQFFSWNSLKANSALFVVSWCTKIYNDVRDLLYVQRSFDFQISENFMPSATRVLYLFKRRTSNVGPTSNLDLNFIIYFWKFNSFIKDDSHKIASFLRIRHWIFLDRKYKIFNSTFRIFNISSMRWVQNPSTIMRPFIRVKLHKIWIVIFTSSRWPIQIDPSRLNRCFL